MWKTAKDPVLAMVMRFAKEGWPCNRNIPVDSLNDQPATEGYDVSSFRKISDSLSVCNGCLLYGSRVVVPLSLQKQVLAILHLGHFGIQRMKQLARTAVYWPRIDVDCLLYTSDAADD